MLEQGAHVLSVTDGAKEIAFCEPTISALSNGQHVCVLFLVFAIGSLLKLHWVLRQVHPKGQPKVAILGAAQQVTVRVGNAQRVEPRERARRPAAHDTGPRVCHDAAAGGFTTSSHVFSAPTFGPK